MIGIVETIQADCRTWVALEDYQALIRRYEQLQPPCDIEEILKNADADEVYDG